MSCRTRTSLVMVLAVVAGCVTSKAVPVTGPTVDAIEADSKIVAIDFSSDSRYFAHLCRNGTLYLRDVLRETSAGERSFAGEVRCVDLGHGQRFAVAAAEGIQVWNTTTERGPVVPTPRSGLRFVLLDNEAGRLAAVGDDGTVTLWDLATKAVLKASVPHALDESTQVVPGAGFGLLYLIGSSAVRVLGLAAQAPDTTLEFARDGRVPVALSRDGRSMASMNPKGTIEVRRLPDGAVQARLDGYSAASATLALSPDGSVLATEIGGGAVELWDVARGERLDRFEATVWRDGGIAFSPDGYLIAWVEQDRNRVRFWSPTRGVVLWQENGQRLVDRARPVCSDLASIIRFRLASEPFERGESHLARGELLDAIRALERASSLFAAFPGLAVALDEARGRHRAQLRAAELEVELAQKITLGDYYTAVSQLETFLREHGRWGDYGYRERVHDLRTMLQHLEAAQAHRRADRPLDAVEEFEKAVVILPELAKRHSEFPALRERLLNRLNEGVDTAFAAKDYAGCLARYDELRRLRSLEAVDWLRVGTAHEALEQRKQAEDAYELVPEGTPEYVRARQSIARIARAAGELTRAKEALEEARGAAPTAVSVESDYAEVCELLAEYDIAVEAWHRVSELDPDNPEPFATIGRIEGDRGRWSEAGRAYKAAIRRASTPRPDLLVKLAKIYERSGERSEVLAAYVDLLDLVTSGTAVPGLGDRPESRVRTWIRELGYVRHRRDWITREQFLREQGWVRQGETWLRPEEAQLREIAQQFEARSGNGLRALSDERYRAEADGKGVLKGMYRREIIRAWGFFDDQNVLELADGRVVYEQLIFGNGRQVYLRNGLVCFWSE